MNEGIISMYILNDCYIGNRKTIDADFIYRVSQEFWYFMGKFLFRLYYKSKNTESWAYNLLQLGEYYPKFLYSNRYADEKKKKYFHS